MIDWRNVINCGANDARRNHSQPSIAYPFKRPVVSLESQVKYGAPPAPSQWSSSRVRKR